MQAQHELMRVARLLQRIRERDRAAFVLRFVEGMQDSEVAESLAISIPTARRRCARAHARLSYLAERDLFLTTYVRSASAAALQSVAIATSV